MLHCAPLYSKSVVILLGLFMILPSCIFLKQKCFTFRGRRGHPTLIVNHGRNQLQPFKRWVFQLGIVEFLKNLIVCHGFNCRLPFKNWFNFLGNIYLPVGLSQWLFSLYRVANVFITLAARRKVGPQGREWWSEKGRRCRGLGLRYWCRGGGSI